MEWYRVLQAYSSTVQTPKQPTPACFTRSPRHSRHKSAATNTDTTHQTKCVEALNGCRMPSKLWMSDPFILIPLFVPISSLCEPTPRFTVANGEGGMRKNE